MMGEKILVVDDEHEIADLVELYLLNENYEVFKCYNAEGALYCIENQYWIWLFWMLCFRGRVDLISVRKFVKITVIR